jgi:hypothetical protein
MIMQCILLILMYMHSVHGFVCKGLNTVTVNACLCIGVLVKRDSNTVVDG